MRFRIRRVHVTDALPHGLMYGFTLHDQGNGRLLGFDNAHRVSRPVRALAAGVTFDHWHRTSNDPGRPYTYSSAAELLQDFFREVLRVMREHGHDLEASDDPHAHEEPAR